MVEADLHISPRLRALLPAHSKEELEQLEANIVESGRVRDAILYWNNENKNLIVDGMTRFEIAKRKSLPYRTEPMSFDSIEDAELWMYDNAAGRRNLTNPLALRKLRGDHYNRLKRKDGGHGSHESSTGGGTEQNSANGSKKAEGQIDTPVSTSGGGDAATAVAAKSGVSASTVKRDGKYVKLLAQLSEPVRKAIEEGRLKVTDAQLGVLAKASPTKQQEVARAVRTGAAKDTKIAMEQAGLTKPKKSACERNEAGHEWVSDGDGKRYCTHCKEDHPDNKKSKPSKGKEKLSAAKLVDSLTSQHVGKLVRGIDAVAVANGGKGPVYKSADNSINDFIGCLKKMRAGEK